MLRISVGVLFLSACAFENVAEEDVADEDTDMGTDTEPSPLVTCGAADKTGMVLCIDFEDAAPVGEKPVFREFFNAEITQQLNVDPMLRAPEQAAQFLATSVFAIKETPRLDVPHVTIEMWTKPTADPGGQNEQGLFDNLLQYKMAWEGGRKIECQIGAVSIDRIESDVNLPLDEWSHVACTFDGNELRVYVNGALEGCNSRVTAETAPIYGSQGSAIGASISVVGTQPEYVDRFDGQLDNVRVYGRPLSASDICKIATGGLECDDRCPSGNGYGVGES